MEADRVAAIDRAVADETRWLDTDEYERDRLADDFANAKAQAESIADANVAAAAAGNYNPGMPSLIAQPEYLEGVGWESEGGAGTPDGYFNNIPGSLYSITPGLGIGHGYSAQVLDDLLRVLSGAIDSHAEANGYSNSVTAGIGVLGDVIGSFLGPIGNILAGAAVAGRAIASSAEDITNGVLGGEPPGLNTPSGNGESGGATQTETESATAWSPFTATEVARADADGDDGGETDSVPHVEGDGGVRDWIPTVKRINDFVIEFSVGPLFYPMFEQAEHIVTVEVPTVYQNSREMSQSRMASAYNAGGTGIGTIVGVRGVSDMFSTRDAVDGHQQGLLERTVDGVSGTVTLVTIAAPVAKGLTARLGLGVPRNVPVAELVPPRRYELPIESRVSLTAESRVAPRGARGSATAWNGFDEGLAGGSIRDLTTSQIKVTDNGIAVMERHLARFGPDKANNVMVDRLRRIARGELEATSQDLNFYSHELREFVRYRRLGWADGVPVDGDVRRSLWQQAHSAALDDYGLPLQRDDLLYHPDAIPFMYE